MLNLLNLLHGPHKQKELPAQCNPWLHMPVYSCRYVGWYIQDKFPSVWRHCWSGHHWRGAWGTTIYRKNLRGGVCDTRKKYLLSYLPLGLMTTKLQLFRYTDDNLFAVPRESKESLGKTAHRTNGIDFAGANCIIYNSLAAMCILKNAIHVIDCLKCSLSFLQVLCSRSCQVYVVWRVKM